MLTREKALEFISDLLDSESYGDQPDDIPECVAAIRQKMDEAEEAWKAGKPTWALHCIGQAAAFGVAALEQHGGDLRDEDPGGN